MICKIIKFPRSTYYEALIHEPSKREIEYNNFAKQVKDAFFKNKQIYGAIKLHRILNRDFTATSINQKWCTDITYIHVLKDGWTYLATVMDLYSRKGNPYDNACIESFHSVLKKEEVYLNTYQDFEEAQMAIFMYIESWYNRRRIHSAINYMTPQQKEDEVLQVA